MKKTLFLLWVMAISAPAMAQKENIVIGHTVTLHSKVMNEERRVMIYLPENYEESSEKCPVVYVLDGTSHYLHAASSTQFLSNISKAPGLIVVAITNTRRSRDMTTPDPDSRKFRENGGAALFASFIGSELIPYINAHYRTQPYNILAGHSLAGFFTFYMMLNHTALFDAYIAISPSLYWNDEALVNQLEQLIEGGAPLNKFLYMTYGREGATGIINSGNRVVRLLETQAPAGLRWAFEYMADEMHPSIPNRAFYEGIERLFEGWMFTLPVKSASAEKMRTHYATLSERFGFSCLPPEQWLVIYGYETLRGGNIPKAIDYFKLAVETYPGSANAYDCLGEAYMKAGEKAPAIANYTKSLELNPDNQNAVKMLEKLGAPVK